MLNDLVRIVVTDHHDRSPVEDILWTDESYRSVYRVDGVPKGSVNSRSRAWYLQHVFGVTTESDGDEPCESDPRLRIGSGRVA